MRYESLSFVDLNGAPLASLPDSVFTEDANGYATLIVGTGAAIPSWITSANGYTFFDLTSVVNYQQLNLLDMRTMLPAAGFRCAAQYVPYRTSVATPAGNLMGDYMPVVDFPLAAALPTNAAPLVGSGVCDVFPLGQPGGAPKCGDFPSPAPAISVVVTQCPGPGCNKFVVQPNPPITISGIGFGEFPDGMPFFNGTSTYLQIVDVTQNWSAGHTGDACSVSFTNWDSNRIQLVAHVNQNGSCPLTAGDQLTVTVWNPQSMAPATSSLTVVPN